MEKMNDLRDLLKHEIEDLYSVEEQIIEALPKMIEKANNKILKNTLSEHLKVTENQKKRLEKIQELMKDESGKDENTNKKKGFLAGLFSGTHVCKGMKGIIDEGNRIMGEDMSPEVLDAAIIASAQKVEHYEICGYGTARTFARELNLEEVAKLLEQTLSEEYTADDLLTELAVSRVNIEAESAGDKSGDWSASGSGHRGARVPSRERASSKLKEMEPATSASSTAAKNARGKNSSARSKGGQPKSSDGVPRNSGTGRGATPSKKTTSSGRATKSASKSSGRTSSRSSSGRSGAGSSSGRGRK